MVTNDTKTWSIRLRVERKSSGFAAPCSIRADDELDKEKKGNFQDE